LIESVISEKSIETFGLFSLLVNNNFNSSFVWDVTADYSICLDATPVC